jgi:hypothetical protein
MGTAIIMLVALAFGFASGAVSVCSFMRAQGITPSEMLCGIPKPVMFIFDWIGR